MSYWSKLDNGSIYIYEPQSTTDVYLGIVERASLDTTDYDGWANLFNSDFGTSDLEGISPNSPLFASVEPNPLTDSRFANDLGTVKEKAVATGNVKLANTIDSIFKYGDKALGILARNGILSNANLRALSKAGYSNVRLNKDGSYTIGQGANAELLTYNGSDNANNAPATTSGIDFTDPKTLIIIFLVLAILAYFLFFYNKKTAKNGKR